MNKIVIAIQSDTVDSLCWRYYGRSSGIVEKILDANPHLSELGVILPLGTEVILPDIDSPQQTKQTIQLWD